MKKLTLTLGVLFLTVVLGGCNWFTNEVKEMERALKGAEMVIQTYDEDSNKIDRVEGKSISIEPDDRFGLYDSEGSQVEKSSVINITVGGNEMVHVGSSLLSYEKGLVDLLDKYEQTVDITNEDKSIPFLNRIVNKYKNITSGKAKIILVRSQSGKPLATFVGDSVSEFPTKIDKSTGLIVDGKYLFIYRSDYTIYELDLLR